MPTQLDDYPYAVANVSGVRRIPEMQLPHGQRFWHHDVRSRSCLFNPFWNLYPVDEFFSKRSTCLTGESVATRPLWSTLVETSTLQEIWTPCRRLIRS